MVRDNSPKVRNKRQLARKRTSRASYDRILIVSEGSKTEPNYFKEIRSAYRLQTANIEVRASDLGTAPIQAPSGRQPFIIGLNKPSQKDTLCQTSCPILHVCQLSCQRGLPRRSMGARKL